MSSFYSTYNMSKINISGISERTSNILKIVIAGILVGMANIIPGVSGGTMMVIFGVFHPLMKSISGITTKGEPKWPHIKYILTLVIGVVIGLLVFSKVMEYCLLNIYTQTMYCFFGMILFSIPIFKMKEMKEEKFNPIPFIIGIVIIALMFILAPAETDYVITDFPDVEFFYIITMIIVGFIAGFAMFLPGVSGSMFLLIIGKYYLFNSLMANVTTFEFNITIPLLFMILGLLVGVIISSKVTRWALNRSRGFTLNLIMGLVVASCIAIIPFTASYDFVTILTSILAVIIGGMTIILLERVIGE